MIACERGRRRAAAGVLRELPLRLHAAVLASTAEPFGAPVAPSSIVGPGYDGDRALSADGCELFFVSDRGGDRDQNRPFAAGSLEVPPGFGPGNGGFADLVTGRDLG